MIKLHKSVVTEEFLEDVSVTTVEYQYYYDSIEDELSHGIQMSKEGYEAKREPSIGLKVDDGVKFVSSIKWVKVIEAPTNKGWVEVVK